MIQRGIYVRAPNAPEGDDNMEPRSTDLCPTRIAEYLYRRAARRELDPDVATMNAAAFLSIASGARPKKISEIPRPKPVKHSGSTAKVIPITRGRRRPG